MSSPSVGRSRSSRIGARRWAYVSFVTLLLALGANLGADGATTRVTPARPAGHVATGFMGDGSTGCLRCHEGIEPMHPEAELSCVDCHGGDATQRRKSQAHVPAPERRVRDERVPGKEDNLLWRRFINPMDLRVVDRTCASCHAGEVERLFASLHGTTAGHLSDGYYEVGLSKERGSRYSVFPVWRAPEEGGAVDRLVQVPPFRHQLPDEDFAKHYTDLARKECMQCHLWSDGRAVRIGVGSPPCGKDGDFFDRGDSRGGTRDAARPPGGTPAANERPHAASHGPRARQ